ncbi:DUF3108 domain-containing protein [Dysgonomonas macrotermitis]|uniref:DUF3108 domain-containing protein n=1 Tax=Dysgonomonas macrotermitis TaxID=1346286 RepID=A0A1M5ENC7_9BACT|nr:DUF3108 domain-containing protein [Dysgonomonas macrotermitis]SHF80803.1 Protein of unknown function [Dysgonomonas macrotermitis]
MKKFFYISALLLLLPLLGIQNVAAQCSINNKYFQAGETLQYDLYIKFAATIKGGYAKLTTQNVSYAGKDAYKMTLVSESQGFARKMFELNDTLACVMTKDLVPLAYMKDAHEGGDYTKERMGYTYANGKVKTRSIRHKNGEFRFDETIENDACTYDLMSVLFYARTLDYSNMKDITETKVRFITGKSNVHMRIIYNGKEKVKANDGNKYNCLKLTLYIADEAFDNGKEAMKVYITDDDNRLPVRLETKLKVGSTRVMLKSYKGNKHPVNIAN